MFALHTLCGDEEVQSDTTHFIGKGFSGYLIFREKHIGNYLIYQHLRGVSPSCRRCRTPA